MFRLFALLALLLTLGLAGVPAAAGPGGAPAGDGPLPAVPADVPAATYKDAAYVQVTFGAANAEEGLRLLSSFPDGRTEAANLGGSEARRTVPCFASLQPGPAAPPAEDPCAGRFFYLDVADSYMFGGINTVELSVSYLDEGFGPVYLDYDAIDPRQPYRRDPALTRKRVELAQRGNTDAWKTVGITLADARLANGLGGADLRIGGPGVLTLKAVMAVRVATVLPPPPIRVLVDGQSVEFTDAYPFIEEGRVLVPLRALFEAVGATVQWDAATRTVRAARGGRTVSLQMESKYAYVGMSPALLDVPARVVDGRTFVPLRFAGEALGMRVSWDAASRTVLLVSAPAGG